MLKKSDIIKLISSRKKRLEDVYGFKTIFLYGSFAKDQGNNSSDVDIAVEVKDDSFETWRNFLHAKEELSGLLGRKIDLVYLGEVNPIIKDEIEKDKVKIE